MTQERQQHLRCTAHGCLIFAESVALPAVKAAAWLRPVRHTSDGFGPDLPGPGPELFELPPLPAAERGRAPQGLVEKSHDRLALHPPREPGKAPIVRFAEAFDRLDKGFLERLA